MPFTGRILRRIKAGRVPINFVQRSQYYDNTIMVASSQHVFPQQNQQRRHMMAKGDDESLALRKQSPSKKKQKSAAGGGPSEEGMAQSKTYKMVLDALNAPVTKPPPASKEEMERRFQVGRNYVIGSFERHNEWNHYLACKIRMKNHAIKMLPKNTALRKAALEIDEEGPPAWRRIPVWTPPIEGFDPDEFLEDSDQGSTTSG